MNRKVQQSFLVLMIGMYSFTNEFCHERRFVVRWRRGVWFVIWILLAFLLYEVVRASVAWACARFIKGREARIRLPLNDDEEVNLR